jgi:hypothetical protein
VEDAEDVKLLDVDAVECEVVEVNDEVDDVVTENVLDATDDAPDDIDRLDGLDAVVVWTTDVVPNVEAAADELEEVDVPIPTDALLPSRKRTSLRAPHAVSSTSGSNGVKRRIDPERNACTPAAGPAYFTSFPVSPSIAGAWLGTKRWNSPTRSTLADTKYPTPAPAYVTASNGTLLGNVSYAVNPWRSIVSRMT